MQHIPSVKILDRNHIDVNSLSRRIYDKKDMQEIDLSGILDADDDWSDEGE